LRLLVLSNAPWSTTGYGRQTALWVPRLAALGHDVAIAAFHGLHGAPLNWQGIQVYPGSIEDPFARDILPGHYQNFRADLVITLMDAWVLDPARLTGMNVAHWMPVDCAPLSAMDRHVLGVGGGNPVAMSEHGRRMLADAGWPEAPYVPHGVDTQVFAPLADRDALREQMGFTGRFVIAVNSANQDPVRKGFAEQLEAFAAFAAAVPEALMLVHSRDQTAQGVNLRAILANLDIADRVIIGDQYQIAAGMVSDTEMARFTGMADVLSNCSYAEGFGLPVLEAQAVGTPVVVTDCSAMTELCGSGWLVEGERWWNKGHDSWWTAPSVPGITAAYHEAHEAWKSGKIAPMRDDARAFAVRYDADRVLHEHWVPALEMLTG
jgi:glycosyltransferase involved in cell wall biosynthesis